MQHSKTWIFWLGSLALVSLSGCESMSPSQCRMADWARQGYQDGLRGESQNRIADYAEDCGKVGIQPNPMEYRRGWDSGIVQFCTPHNGWAQGLQGNSYKENACQGQVGNPQFSYYFKIGMDAHRTQKQIDTNNHETHRLQRRLNEVKPSPKADEERRRIREDLRRLDHDQFRLRDLLSQQQRYAP
jgi:hypothetical protein